MTECVHEWAEGEVGCEDCGSHPSVYCENCETLIDLIFEDDPREV